MKEVTCCRATTSNVADSQVQCCTEDGISAGPRYVTGVMLQPLFGASVISAWLAIPNRHSPIPNKIESVRKQF